MTTLCYNRLPNLRRTLNELGDDVIADVPETDLAFDNPAHGLESRELRSHLHQAIDHLDENYRLLISLRYQNELSYEEMATMLNLPLGTAPPPPPPAAVEGTRACGAPFPMRSPRPVYRGPS